MLGKTFVHYRIVEKLGAGGMGVAYRAEDIRLGRHVALKILPDQFAADPNALERFQREARAASAINHPHICAIYDVGESEGMPFLVMELLEGQPLQERLGGKPAAVDALLQMAIQIADVLAAAHAKGIVHRDINKQQHAERCPQNKKTTTTTTYPMMRHLIAHRDKSVSAYS